MIYLSEFVFPSYDEEYRARLDEKRTCFNTMYPFFVLSSRGLERLDFAPVTLLYGGNGSGKTTALNVIAEALSLKRDAPFNRSSFFDDYVELCSFRTLAPLPEESRAVSSDDVFDYMLSLRAVNEGIDTKREELFDEYFERRRSGPFRMQSLGDYDELKKVTNARKKTLSGYVRESGMDKNVREQSNGESAYFYFTSRIQGAGLYLLDEPENSSRRTPLFFFPCAGRRSTTSTAIPWTSSAGRSSIASGHILSSSKRTAANSAHRRLLRNDRRMAKSRPI